MIARLLIGLLTLALLLPVNIFAAISYVSGPPANCAGSGATMSCSFPTGTVTAGDLFVICLGSKQTDSAMTAPTDAFGGTWLSVTNGVGSSTNGEAYAEDAGDTSATVFYKVATGSESSGSATVGHSGGTFNVAYGSIAQFSNGTGAWSVAAAQGADNTKDTSWSTGTMTGLSTAGDVTTNDLVVHCSARNINSGGASSEAITQTGVTFGAASEKQDNASTSGNNVGIVLSTHPVTAGPSSAAPSVTFTTAANQMGGTVVIRLREVSAVLPIPQSFGSILGTVLK